ncbi:MAG: putative metal-binding motif-containing protein, partial [Byssovorax sp.]
MWTLSLRRGAASFFRRGGLAVLALSILLLHPCNARADLPAGCDSVGLELVEHSCFHASFGPYTQLVAGQGSESASAPNVDPVHTYYEVKLPTPLGENVVTYRVASPSRAGEWAILHDPSVPMRVESETTGELLPLLEHAVPACASLPLASVFSLKDERYRIILGPATVDRTFLLLENVSDFVTKNGRDADGDGDGDPKEVVVSMCVPPAGFVANDRDCDDGNPDIHPGAAERCDGVDQNCNLIPDDVGLPCDVGLGVCQSEGALQCPGPGELATCDAKAGGAGPEACDGDDTDCDGLSDLDEKDLCGEADAPQCVLVLGKTRCGCTVDAHCGGPKSGRICDGGTRTCVDGCVATAGRNGCPDGTACSSGDPAAPGACRAPDACNADAQCPVGAECSADGRCVARASQLLGDGCGCGAAGQRAFAPWWVGAALLGALAWRRRGGRIAGALWLSALLVGCPAQVVEEGVGGGTQQCAPRLSEEVSKHACSHLENGPFGDVVASASLSPNADVSSIHETFQVSFPPDGALARAHLRYTATRPGDHVLFSDALIQITASSMAS